MESSEYIDEIQTINNSSDFELVQYFLNKLTARATGGIFENVQYINVRKKLIENKTILKLLPKWIIRYRTSDQFWPFIQASFETYKERRKFLFEEFSPVLEYLESKTESPIEDNISFDEANINTQWQKAIERKNTDPEAAITMARTLIETVLKYILDEQEIGYKDGAELPDLYKTVARSLNLAPEQHQEEIFKQILGGASSIITGLGAVRNKLGDAHGKSKKSIKPSERHSELAVNLAGSMAMFLFKTFNETKKNVK